MAKSPGDKQLPTTAYAVLGLVSFGETSGYDLRQFAIRRQEHQLLLLESGDKPDLRGAPAAQEPWVR